MGLFFSSLTDNQLIAAVDTFAALLLIWILDFVAQSVPSDAVSGLVFLALLGAALVLLVYLSTRNIAAAVVDVRPGGGGGRAPVRLLARLLRRG